MFVFEYLGERHDCFMFYSIMRGNINVLNFGVKESLQNYLSKLRYDVVEASNFFHMA